MQVFSLPTHLRANPSTALALFQMVDTHSVNTNAHILESEHGQVVRRNYLTVFNTSSQGDRERFFKDELICHLWSGFRWYRPDLITAHLLSNLATATEKTRFLRAKFLEDIRHLQFIVNFDILP